jgi:hypothetical protein
VAATVTVSIAWLGIRSVLVAAAPTRTVPLSAVQLRRVAPLTSPDGSTSGGRSADGSSSGRPGTAIPSESWEKDGGGFNRTFHVVGGDVDFFTTEGAVQVASSAPKPGYTVNVTRYGSDSVMVSFFGNRKVSRVWARWWNGPYAEVTESVN